MTKKRAAAAAHLAFIFGLAATAVNAEIYKCPDAGGKQVFQDKPCTDGQRMKVQPSTIDSTPGYRNQTAPRFGTPSSSDPMVGMGKNHLISLLGSPDSSSQSEGYDGAIVESLTFMQHGKAIVAYLRNGYVFKTNSIERDWIRQRGNRTTRTCPSATDIRNAETNASSISLTDRERRNKQYEIDRMKACVPY